MIHSAKSKYPANVIQAMYDRLDLIDPDVQVWQRPLSAEDGIQALGIFPIKKDIDEGSSEFGNRFGPTIEDYTIGVHCIVRNADMQQGQADHTELYELVEDVLYNDPAFQLALPTLTTVSSAGVRRRYLRSTVQNQRFLSGELSGEWFYLATAEFHIWTEKSYASI